jgi:Sortase domain
VLGAATACGAPGKAGSTARPVQRFTAVPAASAPAGEPVTPSLRPLEVGSRGIPPPPVRPPGGAPAPARIRIPAIGVDASLLRLDLQTDGTIQVPSDYNRPGWYSRGPAPGEEGAAVILGHLDSYTGPAIFSRLSSLRPGDVVRVDRADGSQVSFTVQRISTYSVDAFPSFDVYTATVEPEIRLITCGGIYSRSRGRYLANLVVYASMSS